MDEIDAAIIDMLKKDGRMSFVDVAKQVRLTEGAIRSRVARMVKAGVIQRFTVDTKSDVKAIVMVGTAQSVPTSVVAKALLACGVDKVYEISGNYDIVCFAEAETIEKVNEIIERIRATKGVLDTSTMMVLK